MELFSFFYLFFAMVDFFLCVFKQRMIKWINREARDEVVSLREVLILNEIEMRQKERKFLLNTQDLIELFERE